MNLIIVLIVDCVGSVYPIKPLLMAYLIRPTMDTNSNCSRTAEQDDVPFNPMDPPATSYTLDYYPNITLFYSTGTTSITTKDKLLFFTKFFQLIECFWVGLVHII